ncbi:8-amino-7-oxononanoate synthase [Oleiphilus sp. HI0117]|uniref:8-amino-7-oxononanoate synthase n=1 Tax=Oleiphilus sp. HI0117 TaxID=1822261 RepID=UPI0007C250D6|nr:8-amino-7-oxononanoate synthase [Oleiphilus sp. HI0117]KZZ33756.1 8-amino-7-oxononanoate synthase [Oleiphilus sp. HI0117]
MSIFEDLWQQEIDALKAKSLLRSHRLLSSPQQIEPLVDGRKLLSFCSNDYLGLANTALKKAAKSCIDRSGVGSGASHLVVGHHQEHEALECELAEFTGRDKALVFSSGYMANLAVVSTLVGKGDIVLQDKLNHASLIDGGLLSGARFQRYLHNDVSSLSSHLDKLSTRSQPVGVKQSKALVVSDGIFSMDGDIAPLKDIAATCTAQGALLMVDDAHGLGVIGEQGKGSCNVFGLAQKDVPVLMGTFGKAFGTSGAFVAGSELLIDYLTQAARPYIYTTAMPPAIAAATRASLDLIKKADQKRAHLSSLITYFRLEAQALGYCLVESNSPIQPLIIGSSDDAIALSNFLLSQGILVTAIRPPTVPANTSRLRVTFSADHDLAHVEQLLDALSMAIDLGIVTPDV